MDIGTRVREVREDLGMSQAELARRAGVARNHIVMIEAGSRSPSLALLERIAHELRTEPAELLREPVPLAPKDPQQWERLLASVRERRSEVEAKVEELLELPRGEVNPYQVKWALDEAQGCEVDLLRAQPGSRWEQDKIMLEIDLSSIDLDQLEETLKAQRFYKEIVERLVEAGLVVLRERTGQQAEPVPVGIGA
jgi:transcriptional regulator with XRE-family HTH domain